MPDFITPPPALTLQTLIQTATGWAEPDVNLEVRADICYVLVSSRGCSPHFPNLGRPTNYRHELANQLGCSAREIVLGPACPRVFDASILGYPCTTVLAAAVNPDHNRVAFTGIVYSCALLDARPIQLGWICLRLSSGRVDISGLREELAAAVPLNRRLVLTPPPAADGRLYLHPGQVVTVRCIEATAGANGPAHSDDTDSEGADSAAASSDSTSSDAPSDDPDPDHVRHLDTASGQSTGGLHTTRALSSRQPWRHETLFGRSFWHIAVLYALCLQSVRATPSPLDTSCSPSKSGTSIPRLPPRPLPTPCRVNCPAVTRTRSATAHVLGADLDSHHTSTIQTSADFPAFADLHTLLEESVRKPDSAAYFLAATLIDTLVDHFSEVSSPCDADVNLQAQLHHTRPKLAIGLDSCLPKPKPEAACVTGDIASAPLEYIAALRTLPAQHAATIGTTELGFTWGALVSPA